jgi:hypothetical protein
MRSFIICTPRKIQSEWQFKVDEMDMACSIHGRGECIQGFGVRTRRKETTNKTQTKIEGYYKMLWEELIAYFPFNTYCVHLIQHGQQRKQLGMQRYMTPERRNIGTRSDGRC